MTARLLSDHAACAAYIHENHARLARSANVCAAKLQAMQVGVGVGVEWGWYRCRAGNRTRQDLLYAL
jgi:hypothetical protein